MVGVVHEMVAVAVIDSYVAVGLVVMVAHGERRFAADDVLVVDVRGVGVFQRGVDRVVADELHQRVVRPGFPCLAEVIAHLGVERILLEVEVVLRAIGAVVRQRDQ